MLVAVTTPDEGGPEARVFPEFGHAPTFTLVEVEGGKAKGWEVIPNPSSSLQRGRGPVVAKSLAEKGVKMVVSGEVGPGASEFLKAFGIEIRTVRPGKKVKEALKEIGLLK